MIDTQRTTEQDINYPGTDICDQRTNKLENQDSNSGPPVS